VLDCVVPLALGIEKIEDFPQFDDPSHLQTDKVRGGATKTKKKILNDDYGDGGGNITAYGSNGDGDGPTFCAWSKHWTYSPLFGSEATQTKTFPAPVGRYQIPR